MYYLLYEFLIKQIIINFYILAFLNLRDTKICNSVPFWYADN